MDIGSLLAALTAADKSVAESNPFTPFQDAATGIGGLVLQGAKGGQLGTTDALLGGLLAGLGSGISGNLSDSFQTKQNSLAEDLLTKAVRGQSVFERPSGMSPSVFAAVKNTGNLFALENALGSEAAQREAERKAQFDIATTIAKEKAIRQMNREDYGAIANVPPGQLGEVLKQQATADQSGKLQSTIDDYFEKAKGISSLASAIPGTTAANDMSGVQIGLTNMLQGLQGREMNDSARQALKPTLPDWNDSKAQIEQKKTLFKQMVNALTPSTPLVAGAVQDPTNNKIDLGQGQPGAVPPGMKLQRNRTTGETRLVPQ